MGYSYNLLIKIQNPLWWRLLSNSRAQTLYSVLWKPEMDIDVDSAITCSNNYILSIGGQVSVGAPFVPEKGHFLRTTSLRSHSERGKNSFKALPLLKEGLLCFAIHAEAPFLHHRDVERRPQPVEAARPREQEQLREPGGSCGSSILTLNCCAIL